MPWLEEAWYVAAWSQDVDEGALLHRTICEQPIVVYRNSSGIAALADQCSHRLAPLSRGRVCAGSGNVECPYHGLQFASDGECVVNPHGGRRNERLDIRSYPIVEKHTLAWIWLGQGPADVSLIPDFSYLDPGAPGVVSNREMITMGVDYRLVIDNLLDLSHASFLHRGVLGNEASLGADVDISEDAGTLYIRRTSRAIEPPELFDAIFRNDGEPVDMWSEMRWDAPSNLRHDAGVHEPGSRPETGITLRGTHLITPSTPSSCYYHMAAVRISDHPSPIDSDEGLSAALSAKRRYAFEEEDKPILEAQQRAYARAGASDAEPVMLTIDRGPLRARRILEQRIADQWAHASSAGSISLGEDRSNDSVSVDASAG